LGDKPFQVFSLSRTSFPYVGKNIYPFGDYLIDPPMQQSNVGRFAPRYDELARNYLAFVNLDQSEKANISTP
jgi:hypothetical protein